MQTNPGVIEQYEGQQAEVCSASFVISRRLPSVVLQIAKLTMTLGEREKASQRLEREINLPEYVNMEPLPLAEQDNRQPALEMLVESIGKNISAAFDRKPSCLSNCFASHEMNQDWMRWRDQDEPTR